MNIEHTCDICTCTGNVKRRGFQIDPPSMLCERCYPIARRRFNKRRGRKRDRIIDIPSRQEWITALSDSWDTKSRCFRCMISRVPLELTNHKSPFYATAEHVSPSKGSEGYLVVAAVINDMKSDLDMDEFKKVLPLLSRIVSGKGTNADRQKLEKVLRNLRHWRR